MKRAWLLAVMAMAAAGAQAEEPALTDRGISFQLKGWNIQDAFNQGDETFFVGYIRPYYAWQPDPNDMFYIQGNLYSSNRQGADETSIATRREARNFAEIPEVWWRHSFDTDRKMFYVGVQRFDDRTGLWWDAPLTGLSYRIDSTLVKGYIGVGDRSSYLRTDYDVDDPASNSALYVIGQLSWQWKLDHFLIFRAAHREDKDNNYVINNTYEPAEFEGRPIQGNWVGIELQGEIHRHEYRWPRFEIEAAAMQGEQVVYRTTTLGPESIQIKARQETDLQGVMGRINLEYVWQEDQRWVVGVDAIYASGGDATEGGFRQTGLQTNRNPLYTTSLAGSLTGEALRLELSNVILAGGHIAVSHQDRHEAFVAVRYAMRAEEDDEVLLDSVLAPNGSSDLGIEIDVAYGLYLPVVEQRRGLAVGGFKGKQFMVYASHFEPDFPDPLTPVNGTVFGARFLWAF
ncbi:MAG: algE [Moraxellaceae bacterium]|jgi:hypothetical protein|nr:algE [Moraxellaceae bacterium]MDF3030906.1 algE [Moraxellaceae bacterium]